MDDLRRFIFDRFLPQNIRSRSDRTPQQYRFAVNDFAEFLGREPTLDDLSDETVAGLMRYLLGPPRTLGEITVNERVGRLKTFWNWAARKRIVDQFPTIQRVPVPERLPRAWRPEELRRLFDACRSRKGLIADVPAWRWWFTLHAWFWCTGERTSATLDMQVDHLLLDEGMATLPASIRKGKRKAAVYRLWPDLVLMLREMLPPKTRPRETVFVWPLDRTSFYNHYKRLLKTAGLPHDRYRKPQCMRVSHATWRHMAGEDATQALMHSDPATTRKSYLDPTIIGQDAAKLFRPWDDAA